MVVGFSDQITGNANNDKGVLKLGGVKVEYTIKANSLIQASVPSIIRVGFSNNYDVRDNYCSLNRSSNGGNLHDWNNRNLANQHFIIQQGVNVEANLIQIIKIFGGVNYRIATKLENGRNPNRYQEFQQLSA